MEIQKLSNRELTVALEALVREERATSVQVLDHLVEVERRELYLVDGYGLLFAYCTRKLRYSEPAANRRICSARALAKFPEVRVLLVEGELSLTTLSLVSRHLSNENKDELLASIRGKSRSEVEALLACSCPQTKTVERVRQVVVVAATATKSTKGAVESTGKRVASSSEGTLSLFNNVEPSPETVNRSVDAPFDGLTAGRFDELTTKSPAPVPAEPEKRYALSFSVAEETFEELEEVKAILSRSLPEGVSLEGALKVLLTEYLERHSPKRRQSRRLAATKARTVKEEQQSKPPKQSFPPSRHIPAKVRDEVYCRDEGRCSYVSPDGVRCRSTHNLQFDHIVPVAVGGGHTVQNLRVTCQRHNLHLAKQYFGEEHMQRYVHGEPNKMNSRAGTEGYP